MTNTTALNASQRELLARLVGGRDQRQAGPARGQLPTGTPIPLNAAQARIWFFCCTYPHSAEYNLPESRVIARALTETALRTAVRALMARHDVLRVRMFDRDGIPVQQDAGPIEPPVDWHDLRALTPSDAWTQATAQGQALAARPIPIDDAPLFRVAGMALPDGTTLVALNVHHLIIDGWSRNQLVRELDQLLTGGPLPPEPPVGFLDYLAWENANTDPARDQAELNYWRTRLGGELPELELPADRPRPTEPSRAGRVEPLSISPEDLARCQDLARAEGTTVFVVLLAVYQVFLARMTGQHDVAVGTSLTGRDAEAAETIIGCFVRTVALRTDLTDHPPFREAIRRTHDTLVDAQDHQHVPFDRVVSVLNRPRSANRHPVFQTFFNVFDVTGPADEAGDAGEGPGLETDAAKWDLTVSLIRADGGLDGVFEYATDLFDPETVQRFANVYTGLVRRLCRTPDQQISAAPLLSPAEHDRVLFGLNFYQRPDIPYTSMAQPFEEQAERTPEAVALVGAEGQLRYRELNERANKLAWFLRSLNPGSHVALCVERGFDLLVALYAVTKAGLPYAPIDPATPDGRLAFMLTDADVAMVIVDAANAARIPAGPWPVVSLAEANRWADQPIGNPPASGPAHQVLHLLYTSGTTGRPKAVPYPVDGALANIAWLQARYPYGPGDTALFKTSYGFDVSIWEIFWPLHHGARLAICPPEDHKDPRRLRELTEQYDVTTLFVVPSLMQPFIDSAPAGSCPRLRWALCGGEPVTARIRDSFHDRFAATLINCYGPTEAGDVTEMPLPVEPGAPVPLGRPAGNFRIHVLDENLAPLPIGVPGEAYIAGEIGLGHGYHRRPELTAERFLPDPYGTPGARMYRTGDVCRYRADGVLEHLGRIGRQIKIRGMRVEPAEIEAVLAEHEDVARCVVTVAPRRGGELAAFVVPRRAIDATALAEHAARILPAHMVPASITAVPEIPTFVNGKTDYPSLFDQLSTTLARPEATVVPPDGEWEAALAEIFRDVLGLTEVSVTDSFFTLGGHSLLVLALIDACAQRVGVTPTVGDVFAAQSVRSLAARLVSAARPRDGSLIRLAGPDDAPSIVLVHAASGSVLPFLGLAERLGERYAVFAVQATDVESPVGIEQLAQQYVRAVATPPSAVIGWSMGGWVALEMARTWSKRGSTPAVLMLDTWAPPSTQSAPADAARVRDTIQGLDVLGAEGIDEQQTRQGELARLNAGVRRHRDAFLRYAPDRYDGRVDLLRAAQPLPGTSERFPVGYLSGDRRLASIVREVHARDVPGTHFTLLRGEHVESVADAIASVLDQRGNHGG